MVHGLSIEWHKQFALLWRPKWSPHAWSSLPEFPPKYMHDHTCVISLKDGLSRSFSAFCRQRYGLDDGEDTYASMQNAKWYGEQGEDNVVVLKSDPIFLLKLQVTAKLLL